jgi:site-specific recombinase XerC
MTRMKPPAVPEVPPPILSDDDLRRLLAVCRGPDFEARRDAALIRLLIDTGMRRGECAALTVSDVDMDEEVAGAAVPEHAPSGGRLPELWIGTSYAGGITRLATLPRSGWVGEDPSATRGLPRCFGVERNKRVSRRSTRTRCGTPLPINGG